MPAVARLDHHFLAIGDDEWVVNACINLNQTFIATAVIITGAASLVRAHARCPIGHRTYTRPDCPHCSAPPAARVLVFNERERGVTPFVWAGD